MPRCAAADRSCVQVRNQLTLEPRDLVLEHQLALLQAFHLQFIDLEVHAEAGNDVVERAMLDTELAQAFDVLEQVGIYVVFFFGHVLIRSRHTGTTQSGSLRDPPNGFQICCGLWKSDPIDPKRPNFTASMAEASMCCAPLPPEMTSMAPPPAATKSASNCRRAPADNAYRAGCAREATPPAAQIQPTTSPSTGHSAARCAALPLPRYFRKASSVRSTCPPARKASARCARVGRPGAASTAASSSAPGNPNLVRRAQIARIRARRRSACESSRSRNCLAAGSIQSPKTWMACP